MIENGRDPPAQYYEQPEIAPHLDWCWRAFLDLTTERDFGMGIDPIPRSLIRRYATDELGLAGDEHERFCAVMYRVDADYVEMGNTSGKPKDKGEPTTEVAANDADGVRQLMRRLARRQEALRKKQA